jgi:hypothetical protein
MFDYKHGSIFAITPNNSAAIMKDGKKWRHSFNQNQIQFAIDFKKHNGAEELRSILAHYSYLD